jgi:hypothetical protein
MMYQFAREKIQLASGNFDLRRVRNGAVVDPPHKARVAQPQNRHQPHQVTGEFINIVKLQRFPSPSIKLRRVITLSSSAPPPGDRKRADSHRRRNPAAAERTIASHPMAPGSFSRKVRMICR